MKRKTGFQRATALLMALVLSAGFMPSIAFADGSDSGVQDSDSGPVVVDSTYTITMIDGKVKDGNIISEGQYSANAGENITIYYADKTDEGKVFTGWASDNSDVEFAEIDSLYSKFVMPESDVTITAQYEDDNTDPIEETHTITVNGGIATPNEAKEDDIVTIVANKAAAGYKFDKWVVVEGGVTLKSEASAETTFVMGDKNVVVTANYVVDDTKPDPDPDPDPKPKPNPDPDPKPNPDPDPKPNPDPDPKPKPDPDNNDYSDDTGSTSTPSAPSTEVQVPATPEAARNVAAEAIRAAQTAGSNIASVAMRNPGTVSQEILGAIAAAAGDTSIRVNADTISGNAVDVRIRLNPALVTGDLNLSASTVSAVAQERVSLFQTWFQNTVTAVSLGQKGSFGQPVEIAAKVSADLDVKTLVFYAYDAATNSYAPIAAPNYWLDINGYVHFTTSVGGDIIITDRPLAAK